MQPKQASLRSWKDEQWDSRGCCRLCLPDIWTEACETSKTTAVRVCREGQRFLLKDLHSRRDSFPSKDFVFNGQTNDSALLSRKDVRSTMCGLNPLNLFTSAMFPKNRFALYIFSLSHYITTIVHAMRLKVVNVGVLKGKYVDMWTVTSWVTEERHILWHSLTGQSNISPCEQSEYFSKATG